MAIPRIDPAQPQPLTDQDLIALAAAGDAGAFRTLYERHVATVYRYLRLRVDDIRTAEDLTQDVFFTVYRALPSFTWQGHFRPWLLRCAQNRLANHWRAAGRRPRTVAWPEAEDEALVPMQLLDLVEPPSAAEQSLDRAAVLATLPELTDLQRQVLALRFGLHLSVQETAEVMERSIDAVKSLQLSALGAIRRQLRKRGQLP